MPTWETPLYLLLQTVDRDKEPAEQLQNLKKFDNLSPEQFDELTSGRYVKHEEAAIVMQYLPKERFGNKLDLLLEHLEDGNWPAAWRVANLLAAIGPPVLPAIRKAFRKGKPEAVWLMNIIWGVIAKWDNTLILELKDELIAAAGYADDESASIAALDVLKRVLSPAEFEPLYRRLRELYLHKPDLREELDDVIQRSGGAASSNPA